MIQQVLTDLIHSSVHHKRGKNSVFPPLDDPEFSSADILTKTMHRSKKSNKTESYTQIRYVRLSSSPERDFSPVLPLTIVCEKKINLKNMNQISGITVFEDMVLLPLLHDEEPEFVGMTLRNLAVGTEGIVVLGNEWKMPIMNIEPWFDRVGWICQLLTGEKSV